MKEIWKLIELLNEYEKEIKKSEFYEWEKWIWWPNNLFRRDTRDEEWSHLYSDTADTYVISKKYGFIWWLVENDKIEWETIWNYQSRTKLRTLSHTAWLWHDAEWKSELEYVKETFTDGLLMLLSISSSPIDDLISYLK